MQGFLLKCFRAAGKETISSLREGKARHGTEISGTLRRVLLINAKSSK